MPTADYSSFHQLPGTGADGTKFDNLIDAIQATVNGLDKNNLAAAAGILASQLADPTTGKVLGSSGAGACAAVFPPGYRWDYKQITAGVAAAGANEAAAATIITSNSVTYDGAAVLVTVTIPYATGAANSAARCFVLRDTTVIGQFEMVLNANGQASGVTMQMEDTPSAAAHTYVLKAYIDAGTPTLVAGAGGAGSILPASLKVTKV